jgi:glycosyltransferase involved in cell wall biosynthesis
LKIAQLTYSYKPIIGGADAYADLLCRTFRERGHEAWVYQRAAEVDDPFVRTAPRWQRRLRPRDFWLVPLWLRMRRRELSSMDVLVAHYPNYCPPAYFHPRLVGLSHGVTWDDAPDSWRARRKKRMAQAAFARCSRFVANDTFFLREMGLDIPPGERPFEEVVPGRWFIPNCVDTARFSPGDSGPASTRPPVIAVPRNLYRNRGVHLAVQALGLLREQHPEMTMDLVGAESQPDYAQEIREMVPALGLEGRVRFEGGVPWEAMPGVYQGARLCLVPSTCGEGTSLSALEAMACGTPTITTDVGGLPDLPTVHCRPAPEDLARAIGHVWPRLDELASEQLAAVRTAFTIERWQQAWARVVEDW